MKFQIKFIFLFLLLPFASILSQNIRIGTSENSPFVHTNQNGELEGFSVELARAVAEELHLNPVFINLEFQEKLESVQKQKIDFAIGGISVTEKRAASGILFSYPTMNAGMSILVKSSPTQLPVIPIILGNLLTWEVAKMLLFLLFVLLFWGFWLWLAERGSDVISDDFRKGYQDAIWCAWAIKTTIGFGDVYPKKLLGRTLTIPIFFSGAILIAVVAAPINAAFVQRNLGAVSSSIKSKNNLSGKKVATKKGTVAVEILNSLGAKIIETDKIEDAYELLKSEEVDAVVFDSPNLINYAKTHKDLTTTGGLFAEHHYAFAVAPGNENLLKKINIALLKLRENGSYQKIYDRYF